MDFSNNNWITITAISSIAVAIVVSMGVVVATTFVFTHIGVALLIIVVHIFFNMYLNAYSAVLFVAAAFVFVVASLGIGI
jgi:hypothetical protein